eukprot:76938-Rhodomonas_salina.3
MHQTRATTVTTADQSGSLHRDECGGYPTNYSTHLRWLGHESEHRNGRKHRDRNDSRQCAATILRPGSSRPCVSATHHMMPANVTSEAYLELLTIPV